MSLRNILIGIGFLGLASLTGCYYTEHKPSEFFKDLNNDSKPEFIYLLGETKGKYWGNDGYRDYSLFIKEGLGDGGFRREELLHRFELEPEEFDFNDVDGDGIRDLVYLLRVTGHKNWGNDGYTDYSLHFRKGNGDLTFNESQLIKRFEKKPRGGIKTN